MLLLEAKVVDSTHLELSRPIALPRNKTVVVAVGEPTERDSERWQWVEGGSSGLEAAYGDEEPEYKPAMVKESNPDYGT
jgi:hypothetical protein